MMLPISRATRLVAMLLASLFVVGCAGPAPNYAPSIDNVEAFKKSGIAPSNIGTVTVAADLPGGKILSLRANTMVSPVGANFGDYIAMALRQELPPGPRSGGRARRGSRGSRRWRRR